MAEQALEETEIVEGEAEETQEQTPEPQPTEEQIEAQEEARKYGWRPKEEFDLDPEGWVDADRFLELPSTQRKVLKDTNRDLHKEIGETKAQYEARIERLEQSYKTASKRALDAQKAQFEAQLEDIQTRQREAVETADTEAFDALEKRKATLMKNQPQEEEPAGEPQYHPDVQAYIEKNDWIKDDFLREQARQLIGATPGLAGKSPNEQLAFAENKMRTYYPHMFKAEAAGDEGGPPKRQMVDGGGLAPREVKKGVNSLPPEAVRAGKGFVEDGVYKNLEEYAADYFSEG